MDELADLLTESLASTTFLTREVRDVSAEQLRNAYAGSLGCNSEVYDTLSARPSIAGACMDRLTAHLRTVLREYVDDDIDYVGHSFDVMDGHTFEVSTTRDGAEQRRSTSTVSSFASGLVRAAAVLGPQRASQLLSDWSDGAPLRFKVCTVLSGGHAVDPFDLGNGLRVYRLPLSSQSLSNSMPDAPRDVIGQILGRTVLELDAFASPALTVFPQTEGYPELQTYTALAPSRLDELFVALSLVLNQRIGIAWSWNDFGDARPFCTSRRIGLTGPGIEVKPLGGVEWLPWRENVELFRYEPPQPNLSVQGLERACGLLGELRCRTASDERFNVAVHRWMAAVSRDLLNADRVIDLRIALEALYVDQDQGELSFRLATTAARHLRDDVSERKEVRDTLKRFYNQASRVVHGGATGENRRPDVAVIEHATTLCRDGILKMLENRSKPARWDDFLLE